LINTGIPALLGTLTRDLIFACDAQSIVSEANPLATRLLGSYMVGQPLIQLLSTGSHTKGNMFLEHLSGLAEGGVSDTWELLFDTPSAEPLLLNLRAGRLEHGGWLFVASRDSPQLTALYHEVLAMNNELTNLIRQISKEQARLITQLERLADAQERHYV
jgi:hypothetical protein